MDGVAHRFGDGLSAGADRTLMPLKAPMAMPVQDLSKRPPLRHKPRPDDARLWQALVCGGALALTCAFMATLCWWLGRDGLQASELGLVALFGSVGIWISLAATTALIGLRVKPTRPTVRPSLALDVALLIPIYHEDPDEVMAGALAMLRDLAAQAPRHRLSLYILSDTRGDVQPEVTAFAKLRALAPTAFPVFYRHRTENTDRKSGNLRDWITQWGGAHDAMVVLDADSLMGGRTLVALADDMAADPQLGLLQTAPQLIGASSVFARMQAFAGAAYGPLLGRGLAKWSGDGANFWGHNAIIRISAFAASAGLPKLPPLLGKGPGQLIWSHDFVEAALLRRRGWSVRLRPDLEASFENTPPSLIDHTLRDRRWCQGNLQHLRLLGTAGVPLLSRLHLLHGAASYLVSLGWLLLLVTWTVLCFGIAPAAQGPMGGWPILTATIVLLLLPKSLAVGALMTSSHKCARFGGRVRLLGSVGLELILSVLYAPILMIQQSQTILGILCGKTIGWSPQNRQGGQYSWATLLAFHQVETLLGGTLITLMLLKTLPVWLAPIGCSLAAAVPLSALSARKVRASVMATPQDRGRTSVQRNFVKARDDLRNMSELWTDKCGPQNQTSAKAPHALAVAAE